MRAGDGAPAPLPARAAGGDIRQQRGASAAADFNDSFCHAIESRRRIIQPRRRIDGGVKDSAP